MIVSTKVIVDTSEQAIQVRGRGSKPPKRYRTVEGEAADRRGNASAWRVSCTRGAGTWSEREPSIRLAATLSARRAGAESDAPSLLPVHVTGATVEAARSASTARRRISSGVIHLELPKGQVRIAGRVDAEALRIVLEKLLA